MKVGMIFGAMLAFSSVSDAFVDCTDKVEQVLSDGYNVGWKLNAWQSLRTITTTGFETTTHPETSKAWYTLVLTAISTGQSVIVRYGSLSSCDAVPTSSDVGYYYRLKRD
jgi:hypothetical protein